MQPFSRLGNVSRCRGPRRAADPPAREHRVGKPGWPNEADLLEFEAKVTGAARAFPCIVVCMYDVRSLAGTVILHGAFETHPVTVCGNLMRENRHYVEVDAFLARRREAKTVRGGGGRRRRAGGR